MHSANCKVWWRRNNGLGLFLNDFVVIQLCANSLGKALSCFSMTVPKARSIQKWFVEIGVEELDWPAQSPDIIPIKHLWDDTLVAEWKQVPAAMF